MTDRHSHHPPVTAYSISNKDLGLQLQGYNGQKASVSKSLTINIKVTHRPVLCTWTDR